MNAVNAGRDGRSERRDAVNAGTRGEQFLMCVSRGEDELPNHRGTRRHVDRESSAKVICSLHELL